MSRECYSNGGAYTIANTYKTQGRKNDFLFKKNNNKIRLKI